MNKDQYIISVRQPWAWLIVKGYKDVENRTWSTNIRGKIYIHAPQKFDVDGYDWVDYNFMDISLPEQEIFQKGKIVGEVELVDCVTEYDSPWFSGPYGFVLRNPKELSIPVKRGQLGFFKIQ